MAASDHHQRSEPPSAESPTCLPPEALRARLDEEIHRAERHGTHLSCLLLSIDDIEEMAREHGSELPEQTLSYVGVALRRELRDFDRIGKASDRELLIVLPGADGPRGEIVARRVLDRLRTIKLESRGTRRPLSFSLGLATWHSESGGEELLARSRAAGSVPNGEDPPGPLAAGPGLRGLDGEVEGIQAQAGGAPAFGRSLRS
jgi:GGDEF domain-containing protein